MYQNYEYLQNPSFLKEIDNLQVKEQYVKIIILDWKTENSIDEIQGKVVSGNNNLNGKSVVRRTCSLSVLADEKIYDILTVKNLISINKKIKVEVGFKNTTTYYKHHEKIWFPLGVYIIKTASIAHNNNGINISLTLNDKMSLLNGEVGGVIPAATTFSEIDILNDKEQVKKTEKLLIFDIIKNLVHEYGGEDLNKIIINDIPLVSKRIIKWTGATDLYLVQNNGKYEFKTLLSKEEDNFIIKSYGEDIGYEEHPFIYPSNKPLTCSPGETVTSVLDKIKNCLGNFEYYYDVFGNFIFQEIKNYLNNSQATQATKQGIDPTGYLINRSRGSSVYTFNDAKLITSYSNNPQFQNIKNDFIIWGEKTSPSGVKIPIRYHLAIDEKPTPGNIYTVKIGVNSTTGKRTYQPVTIYYFKDFDELMYKLEHNEIIYDENYYYYCKFPRAGDINYNFQGMFVYDYNQQSMIKIPNSLNPIRIIKTNDWRSELFMQGLFNTQRNAKINYYYRELAIEWPKIYDMCAEKAIKEYDEYGEIKSWETHESGLPIWQGKFIGDYYNLDYYLDFIDTTAAIGQFSVNTIGRRTKVINDKNINCIFSSPVPEPGLYIIEDKKEDTDLKKYNCELNGYSYALVNSELYQTMTTGGGQNSAYDKIRSLLYQNTSYNETISISVIPIFHLEPNTRITVNNKKACIQGDYVINSISLPLAVNGTMTISCTKALEQI